MFLFENDFIINKRKLHGVRYTTVSFYSGDRDIFQKVGDLIAASFASSNMGDLPKESLVDSGIAIDEE